MMGGQVEGNPSVSFCYSTLDKRETGGRSVSVCYSTWDKRETGGRRSGLSLCIARRLYWEPLLIAAIKEDF